MKITQHACHVEIEPETAEEHKALCALYPELDGRRAICVPDLPSKPFDRSQIETIEAQT